MFGNDRPPPFYGWQSLSIWILGFLLSQRKCFILSQLWNTHWYHSRKMIYLWDYKPLLRLLSPIKSCITYSNYPDEFSFYFPMSGLTSITKFSIPFENWCIIYTSLLTGTLDIYDIWHPLLILCMQLQWELLSQERRVEHYPFLHQKFEPLSVVCFSIIFVFSLETFAIYSHTLANSKMMSFVLWFRIYFLQKH